MNTFYNLNDNGKLCSYDSKEYYYIDFLEFTWESIIDKLKSKLDDLRSELPQCVLEIFDNSN